MECNHIVIFVLFERLCWDVQAVGEKIKLLALCSIHQMYVYVCICVCVCKVVGTLLYPSNMYVCMCIYKNVYM